MGTASSTPMTLSQAHARSAGLSGTNAASAAQGSGGQGSLSGSSLEQMLNNAFGNYSANLPPIRHPGSFNGGDGSELFTAVWPPNNHPNKYSQDNYFNDFDSSKDWKDPQFNQKCNGCPSYNEMWGSPVYTENAKEVLRDLLGAAFFTKPSFEISIDKPTSFNPLTTNLPPSLYIKGPSDFYRQMNILFNGYQNYKFSNDGYSYEQFKSIFGIK